jgi:hypothetical protein
MDQPTSHWMNFYEFDTWGIFENMSSRVKFDYNLAKVMGTLYDRISLNYSQKKWQKL